MKLNPSIIALKDFENINVIRLKLARYSTASKALSINASERFTKLIQITLASSQHDVFKNF